MWFKFRDNIFEQRIVIIAVKKRFVPFYPGYVRWQVEFAKIKIGSAFRYNWYDVQSFPMQCPSYFNSHEVKLRIMPQFNNLSLKIFLRTSCQILI